MPTYAYACTACDHRFEAHQSFTDDALTECPQCQGRLRKLFSSVGVVFKGSGFYRTDSRAAANGAKGSGGSDTSSEAKASGEGKAASKGGESTATSTSDRPKSSNGSSGPGSGSGSSTKVPATAGSAA